MLFTYCLVWLIIKTLINGASFLRIDVLGVVTRVMTVEAKVGGALSPDMIGRGALPTCFGLSGIKDS